MLICKSCCDGTGKHELQDLQGVTVADVLHRDWERNRGLMQNRACRSVALGAVVSPAWFKRRLDVAMTAVFAAGISVIGSILLGSVLPARPSSPVASASVGVCGTG